MSRKTRTADLFPIPDDLEGNNASPGVLERSKNEIPELRSTKRLEIS